MKSARFAMTAILFSGWLPAATRIDDPKTFVAQVYQRFSGSASYEPKDDIYTPRLRKLLRDDKRKAKGEVGCVDFVFWVNGQDWTITNLDITSADAGPDRKTVTAKFVNLGTPQEIRYEFLRKGRGWLLDEVRSAVAPPWTLSELLQCSP